MKYTVRNKDGELTYGSMEEIKTAYVIGLIEPEDEIVEEGAKVVRKAGAIPLLVTARKVTHQKGQSNAMRGWVIGALVLAMFAFYFLIKGVWTWGGLAAFGVVVMLYRVTTMAAKRPKR